MTVIPEYLSRMSQIQDAILTYIEDDNSPAINFMKLITLFQNLKIQDNKHDLKTVLHILSNIADNHHRGPNFFDKIQKILKHLKFAMQKHFSNFSIFNVFKSNKRILLLLIQEHIMHIDRNVASIIINDLRYTQYLYNYLKEFLDKYTRQKNTENFEEKQEIGENDSYIAKLIREDKIDDFISYVEKEKISLYYKIEESIFESNSFLVNKKSCTLIEYAAFFGSNKIINYLLEKRVSLQSSLWLYTVHSNSLELIHLLEEKKVKPEKKSYKNCLEEAIKCHHKGIVEYILKKYISKEREQLKEITNQGIKYFNIYLIQNDFIDESLFYVLCEYDYYTIADFFLKNMDISINKYIMIFKVILFNFLLNYLIEF